MNKAAMGITLGIVLIFAVCSVSAYTATMSAVPFMPTYGVAVSFAIGIIAGLALVLYTFSQFKGDSTILAKINHFSRMYRRAKEYIHIQTDLDNRFFNNPKIIEALRSAA